MGVHPIKKESVLLMCTGTYRSTVLLGTRLSAVGGLCINVFSGWLILSLSLSVSSELKKREGKGAWMHPTIFDSSLRQHSNYMNPHAITRQLLVIYKRGEELLLLYCFFSLSCLESKFICMRNSPL